MMRDSYYSAPISKFISSDSNTILGELARAHHHALDQLQRNAWIDQIRILKAALGAFSSGHIFFEFSIPRMGKRADVVIISGPMVIVIEFKVGSATFDRHAIDQVHDYALDLKNFHLGSHHLPILPVLVATGAIGEPSTPRWAVDRVAEPVLVGPGGLTAVLGLEPPHSASGQAIDIATWRGAGYQPTPTIIEAAEALYRNHAVDEISRSDASAKNLQDTSKRIAEIIEHSKLRGEKSICFVTGVPGAGKTLAGLNIATKRARGHGDEHAVFLSGNGPLVDVLREALARDQKDREGISKKDAERATRQFVQNIHHFRDHYVRTAEVPFEKVVVFDEAQRAWTSKKASAFMKDRHGLDEFDQSEPDFLIGVMDRHTDWCTIVCLIGGGQEINTGEAGISEWLSALKDCYPNWNVHASSLLDDPHYTVDDSARKMLAAPKINRHPALHLSVSMRSFRAERLSAFVSAVLDGNSAAARQTYDELSDRYPIALTRKLGTAKTWLRSRARGSERYGLVASSGALRLRPEGIHVKSKIEPAHWFLDTNYDVRSSFALEQVATQFDIQGLELDWTGVCWDADLRRSDSEWRFNAFKGSRWQKINDGTNQLYLLNTYRVLLTRARQGMVVYIPWGDELDATRLPSFYNETFNFLVKCGLPEV